MWYYRQISFDSAWIVTFEHFGPQDADDECPIGGSDEDGQEGHGHDVLGVLLQLRCVDGPGRLQGQRP